MGSKKNKGTKTIVDSRTKSVQPSGSDMSKYARAVSNKSKVNYAALKLVRHEEDEAKKPPEKGKKTKKPSYAKPPKDRKAVAKKDKGNKKKAPGNKPDSRKSGEKQASPITAGSADERYSNALESGDHYSSAVEKYYLKYPDRKRPAAQKKASAVRKEPPKRRKKRSGTSAGSSDSSNKRSIAEIAVSNKHSSSVRKHARSARNAKARGVISTKIGNRSVYIRKRKNTGAFNVLMITLLLVFLVSVGVLVFFHIGQIRIEGDSPYTKEQIMSLCSFKKGSNILFIDSAGTENRITRELPYIETCTVERRLPSTVVIKVEKADVLGVAQGQGGQWAVLSSAGKILETSASKGVAVNDDSENTDQNTDQNTQENTDQNTYTPGGINTAEEIASMRLIPLITGVDFRSEAEDGFLVGDALEKVRQFTVIRDAFKNKDMRMTSVGISGRGYEADYDGRISLIFGDETDRRTIFHHLDEIYDIIFVQKAISETDKGEFRFSKGSIYFRRKYDVSEEELQSIDQQKRQRNQKKLYEMAEIFMSVGKDWFNGKLKTE